MKRMVVDTISMNYKVYLIVILLLIIGILIGFILVTPTGGIYEIL